MAEQPQERQRELADASGPEPLQAGLFTVWFWRLVARTSGVQVLGVAVVLWLLERQLLGGIAILSWLGFIAGFAALGWAVWQWHKTNQARRAGDARRRSVAGQEE